MNTITKQNKQEISETQNTNNEQIVNEITNNNIYKINKPRSLITLKTLKAF